MRGERDACTSRGGHQFPGGVVDEPETLRRTGEPVHVIQAGVEPLRAVGRRDLVDEHVVGSSSKAWASATVAK